MTKKKDKQKVENDQSFQEKLNKEKLIDGVPDEEVRKEEREEEQGRKSKGDSITEDDYDEDLKS
ncbi:hypothetical protein [Halobacillus litoralis]|uniref:hypothetical protein n=1 Tax=Halobacillus litoralis TaxID=45668 RepID=UPI001CFDEF80|nr:hypothetical protein [Halobacillus litoralis]